ncbi:sporulation integral membrane protein YlbJ [Clostridium sp. cel8]|uniref:sporulation integral membrane protein YlbJ n=1 Tax=unclassified Clostridium TaxID=2614128 RepID=UPI0015F429BA|nr:sporulation integral membrane protein YlbJ [Clostridium sp. cel8]MBA5850505.1 sporulation integral membrane protein YlbJ [Clostridium sp. cel8]
MNILFYTFLLALIFILAFVLKDRNTFVTIVCSILIIQIILSPKVCMDGAISGAILFFYKVFPSLFSFLIVSNVIIRCNGISIYSKLFGNILCFPLRLPKSCSFAIVISILCGYPLGAKYACDLYENGSISIDELQRLLNIASNSSPLFILGSVGISMFKSSQIGYLLLLSNLISCMIMGFILPAKQNYKHSSKMVMETKSSDNIGSIFKNSIESSIKTCLSIGGFVTVFSVVNNIFENNLIFNLITKKLSSILGLSNDIITGTILGIIEMTNGCNLISNSQADIYMKIILVSFLFTFSGFSIISQVYSFTYKFKVSMKKYIFRKAIHGIICSLISIVLFKIYERYTSMEMFSYNLNPSTYKGSFFISIILFLILPIILFKFKRSFHIS